MPTPRTVMIAAPQYVAALKGRTSFDGELVTFADSDPLQAIDAIVQDRPSLVVLERFFATTPRGAALINRLKADPTLAHLEIRVVSHDTDYTRVVAKPSPGGAHTGGPAPAAAPPAAPTIPAAAAPQAAPGAAPLDRTGTRRAPRFRVRQGTEIQLDGAAVLVIDLSTIGAQVVAQTVLRPNQRTRVALVDEQASVRCNGVIAWASFELPRGGAGAQYRAGVEFLDADPGGVDAFCGRHRA